MMIRPAPLAALLCLALTATAVESTERPTMGAPQASEQHAEPIGTFRSDRIRVTVEGEGPDLILIPGLNSSPQIWDATAAHLGSGWRIHRIHVRGFAGLAAGANADGPVLQPAADEIGRYIREAGLERPALVGHSMGGTLALSVAAAEGDGVSRVMVIDMVPFMGAAFGPAPNGIEALADQIMAATAAMSDETWAEQGRANVMAMVLNEAIEPLLVEHALTSDRAVSTQAFRDLMVTDLRPRLGSITAPVTVLYIKLNDPRITDEMTDGIYRQAYGGLVSPTFRRVPDAAHFLMFDQPSTFHAALDAFLVAP